MVASFNTSSFQSQLRAAQRKAEQQITREVDRVNRENQRRVDDYNRRAQRHNDQVIRAANAGVARVNAHNQRVDRANRSTINDLNRQLRTAGGGNVTYTDDEQQLADRVTDAVRIQDDREWDVFLSYAHLDGATVGVELRDALEALGVRVWFDAVAIRPGQSQSLQMDQGLRKASCGVAVLTPAYLAGRFWTERELGALLHKPTLIPVLHGVTFPQVAEYSGILPDLAGFETNRDSVEIIAEKIAVAVLPHD